MARRIDGQKKGPSRRGRRRGHAVPASPIAPPAAAPPLPPTGGSMKKGLRKTAWVRVPTSPATLPCGHPSTASSSVPASPAAAASMPLPTAARVSNGMLGGKKMTFLVASNGQRTPRSKEFDYSSNDLYAMVMVYADFIKDAHAHCVKMVMATNMHTRHGGSLPGGRPTPSSSVKSNAAE